MASSGNMKVEKMEVDEPEMAGVSTATSVAMPVDSVDDPEMAGRSMEVSFLRTSFEELVKNSEFKWLSAEQGFNPSQNAHIGKYLDSVDAICDSTESLEELDYYFPPCVPLKRCMYRW